MSSPSLDEELAPGRVIERYEVKRQIGAGAMAAVYEVEHTTLRTRCALKVLTYSRSRRVKERMIQEGQHQARLRHPNIVQVHDVFTVDGMPALLLEYVDGPTLEEELDEALLPLDEAEAIFRGIVAAVQAAHAEGLVHRDLKPANILLHRTPSGPVPKVADFGLAKAWADDDAPNRTRAGTALGTPQYMAPEQATDASDVDHRADLFALGCILYELVCGRRAFTGTNLPTIFNQVIQGDYPPPEAVSPDVPERIRRAITGCLEPDRDKRIGTCEELLAVLGGPTAVPDAPPVTDGPATLPEQPVTTDELGAVEPTAETDVTPTVEGPVIPSIPPHLEPPPADEEPTVEAGPGPGALVWVAALGLPAALGASIVLILGIGAAAWFLWPAGSGLALPGAVVEGPCGGPRGEIVGYAWAGRSLDLEQGATWTVDRATNVRAEFPHEDNDFDARTEKVCVLPEDARVRIEAPVERPPGAVWVPVVAGSVSLPD